MINSSANTLFQLLRLALGNKAECSLPADIDWKSLIDLSFEQGVAALTVDGLGLMVHDCPNQELEIDKEELEDLKYEWFGEVFQAEEDYSQHLEAISSLAKTYAQAGIRMMLLKGYGLGLNYPIPEHRPTGDIDVYLFNDNPSTSSGQADDDNDNQKSLELRAESLENDISLPAWKKGDELIRSLGIEVDSGHEHHTTFQFRGPHSLRQTQGKLGSGQVMVENHYDFINTKAHRDAPRIEAKLKELASMESREHLLPDGTRILLPSADFNVIFLIRHLGQHFAGEHITLRQILDYGLFLQKEGASVHWGEIEPFIKEMGIWTFFNQINAICVDYLGLRLNDVPEIERNEELEKRILEDVLHPEFAEEKPSGLIPVLAFKARRWWHNRWKHPLVYDEWLLPMLLTLAWSHLRRIKTIKD